MQNAVATTFLTDAVAHADAKMATARLLAEALCEKMQKIHGGSWRIQIDHEAEFVMIARRADRPASPKRGEVV